ncbi:hypothetical protein BC830DRAFT_1163269 [Chytriomyces sp. MP71]|nr:hypothetical protein BC830DRAFT_1163269 [Chytriomyces sp. MP71]
MSKNDKQIGNNCFGEEALRLVRDVKRSRDSGQFHAYNEGGVRNVKLEMRHLLDGIGTLLSQRGEYMSQMEAAADAEDEGTAQNSQALATGCTTAAQLHHTALRRNRRLLLVYHRARMDALRDMAWDLCGGSGGAGMDAGGRMDVDGEDGVDDEDALGEDSDNEGSGDHAHRHKAMVASSHASGLPAAVMRGMSPNEVDFLEDYRALLGEYRGTMLDLDLTAPLIPPSDLFIDIRVLKDLGEIVTENGCVLKLMAGDQLYVRRTDVEKFITLGYAVQLA